MHHNGVSHRYESGRPSDLHSDLKPDNVLATGPDREICKLVDFVRRRLRKLTVQGVSDTFSKATDDRTFTRSGSPAFLAPELCLAVRGPVSAYAADVYALGVTTFAMLFAKLPFYSCVGRRARLTCPATTRFR